MKTFILWVIIANFNGGPDLPIKEFFDTQKECETAAAQWVDAYSGKDGKPSKVQFQRGITTICIRTGAGAHPA